MSIVVLVVCGGDCVIASDGRAVGADGDTLADNIPKFYLLAPDLALAVSGTVAFAQHAAADLVGATYRDALQLVATRAAIWDAGNSSKSRGRTTVALVGVERATTPACVRFARWDRESRQLVTYLPADVIGAIGCFDETDPGWLAPIRAAAGVGSLEALELAVRRTIADRARQVSTVGGGIYSYTFGVDRQPWGTGPDGRRVQPALGFGAAAELLEAGDAAWR